MPRIGDVRHIATWIDREAMKHADPDVDLSDRLECATRGKQFSSLDDAKEWAQRHAHLDEYGSPRVETQTFGDDHCWERSDEQELVEDSWHPLYQTVHQ